MKRKWYFLAAIVVLSGLVFFNFKKAPVAVASKSVAGKPAPDFKLENIDGGQTSLSDLKGKVVYLDIWATWCRPCLEEMKKGKKLKEAFKGNKNVVFLYVSIDKDVEKWKNYVKSNNVEGVHLISREGAEENILERYNAPYIPRFVLIDKAGNIVQYEAKAPSDPSIEADIANLLK
jgi:peroxiredoxin